MKLYHIPLIVVLATLGETEGFAQISNSNNPHPSAALDVEAANKGLLLPRIRLTGPTDTTTVPTPATSLMVYHTTTIAGMPAGFYFWNGTKWEALSGMTHALSSTANTMTSTVNGVDKTAPIVNTNTISSSANTMTTAVNGVAATAASIINTNALALTGSNLTSTINGKVSNTLDIGGLAGWKLNGNTGTTTSFLGTTNNQPLRFWANNAERMTLNNGRLGLGNTNPFGAANGSLHIGNGSGIRKIILYQGARDNDHEFFGFGFTGTGSILRQHVGGPNAVFGWYAPTDSTSTREIMRLRGNGNLGIGTDAPTQKLHVAGKAIVTTMDNGTATDDIVTVGADGLLKKRAVADITAKAWQQDGNLGTADSFIGTTNNYSLRFFTNNSEKMRITANGRLGIGTDAPNAPLQFANTGTWRKIVLLEDANNDVQFTGFGASTASFTASINATTSNFLWYAGASATVRNELMRLTGTGNLGLGVTPTAKLDVNGTTRVRTLNAGAAADAIVTADANGTLGKRSVADITAQSWQLAGNTGTATSFLGTTTNIPLRFRTNNTEKMTILENGNVGIGTTAPNALLHLKDGEANRKLVLQGGANDHQYYGFGINTGMLRSQVNGTGGVFGWYAGVNATTSNEVMRLTGGGKLGIGATPSYYLDVKMPAAQGYISRFYNTEVAPATPKIYSTYFRSNTAATEVQGAWVGMQSNHGMALMTNDAPRVVITATGDVGIGTNNAPSTKLDVNGSARIRTLGNGAAADAVVTADASGNLRKLTRTITATTPAAVTTATSGTATTITVKNDLAQWNANRIQGIPVSANAPSAGNLLRYDGTQWVAAQLSTYYYTALKSNTGTAIGSGINTYYPIEMNNKIYNPFGAVSADGKTVTLKSGHAGVYAIKYAVNMYTNNMHTPTRFRCQVSKNGVGVETTNKTTVGTAGINETLNGTFVIALAANDYIRVELNLGGSFTAFNPATVTSFIMEKIN